MSIREASRLELRELLAQRDRMIDRQRVEHDVLMDRLRTVEKERDMAVDALFEIRSYARAAASNRAVVWAQRVLDIISVSGALR